ncbi:outer membrane protein OmpK [Acinetobacter sp. WZC-1]|uniref:outer membrane protein OmpK n=1 Tax=Acinetobacter sp. WZC-1 TaxID=3459034 RepID=UPI00403DC1B2
MKHTSFIMAGALACTATLSHAAPLWQDFSITGLYGKNYELTPDKEQSTVTFEYAAKLKYGDFFGFADRLYSGGESDTYFEVSPRLSLSAVSGRSLALGPVKDVLITTTWEGGKDMNNYLYGLAVDLDIPYFQYAQLNFYRANNDNIEDDYQLTFSFAVPFKIASEEFLADGFLDWSTAEDDHGSELNWTTQWKWNAGKHISPDTRLYLGIEHSVWHNKYGVQGRDENNVSALIKYHF